MSIETLTEYVNSRGIELATEAEAGVIRGVKILGPQSQNGRSYSPEAISKAAPLYEGAKVNVNHPRERRDAPRDYQDRIGQLANVRIGEHGLFADLRFNPKHALAEQLVWDANNAPESVGLSHNIVARVRGREGNQVVEAITTVRSVDLVADPATTRGLFEEATNKKHEKERVMELSEMSIAEVRAARRDVVEAVVAETTTAIAESEEATQAAAELAALRDENDKFKAAAALQDRVARTTKLLEEAKLPEDVVTDLFRQQLVEADEEGAKALIEDRRILAGLHLANLNRPKSRAQSDAGPEMDHDKVVETIIDK